ncbi:MAG: hypothetical protein ACD_62C00173G0001, partial [uncultured bacterium]
RVKIIAPRITPKTKTLYCVTDYKPHTFVD